MHVINELNVPILAMGIQDVVISASPEGILVSDKEESSYIKPYVDQIDQQIMFAEKSWGSFRVHILFHTIYDCPAASFHNRPNLIPVLMVVIIHTVSRIQCHFNGQTAVFHILQAGDVITIQAEGRHTVIAWTELKLTEIQIGKDISVHDKQKFPLE